jgi:hypothetical protein
MPVVNYASTDTTEQTSLTRSTVARVFAAVEDPGPVITFRARVGGEYVYFTGSPPPGATDIVIVSRA